MSQKKPRIAMVFKRGGENGGPFVSHKRIMDSTLQETYEIVPLYFPEGRMGIFCPKHIKNVREQIRTINPDIIQIPGLQLLGFHSMVAAVLEKKKTVLAIHGSSMEAIGISPIKRYILKLIEKYTLNKATIIYAVSSYVEKWQQLDKYRSKCYGVIYNLPQKDTAVKRDIRSELGIEEDDIVVVSTGRIVREKGYDTFLKVLKKTPLQDNVKYVIAGAGEYLDEMSNQIRNTKLQDRVFLLGYRNDINDILAASDIFMILTRHETLCISLVEACQFGLACIASNVGGIPEIITDEESGYLVNPEDVEEITCKLNYLISHRDVMVQLGEKARQNIDRKFGRETILHQLDDIYRRTIYDEV